MGRPFGGESLCVDWPISSGAKPSRPRAAQYVELINPVDRRALRRDARSRTRPTLTPRCSVAAKAFASWKRTTPVGAQSRALLKIADVFEAHAEELVAIEAENTGKIIAVTMSEEIPPMLDQIRFFAGAARMLEGRGATEYMAGMTSYVRREPVGVCGAVTPWNYPMMMAVWKWAPAIAAGNTMVLKPSDTTPVSTLFMAELMSRGVARGRVQRRLR